MKNRKQNAIKHKTVTENVFTLTVYDSWMMGRQPSRLLQKQYSGLSNSTHTRERSTFKHLLIDGDNKTENT